MTATVRASALAALSMAALALAAAPARGQSYALQQPKVGGMVEYDKFVTVPCKQWTVTEVNKAGMNIMQCGEYKAYSDTETGALVRVVSKDGDKMVQFKPYAMSLQYPLSAGKTWKGKYEGYTNDDGASWEADVTCKVGAALEKVKVAAGEFDALKIECEDAWQAGVFKGVSKSTSWWAPAVGAVVKTVNPESSKWNMELLSAK
jgi:hypothetical protein